ncbi:2-dehydropantoate 2-reductase [Pseudolysinimonas sp.]|uniref:ketopantoate reductase family protein n=1 Tax=Pseudolysinimonas sp. TaxID=2680009 RepID=UPI00286B3868|nr:2-dehydropantoate 2-reductase [Pseudolysinimonas sp.]
MRVAVIGAGAVGGLLAALLDRAGNHVEVTARGEHLAAIRADGIVLDGGYGSHVARVAANETLTERPELAILATKAQDAAAALAANVELLDGVPLLVAQNGLGGIRVGGEALPSSPLVGGLALFATSYLSPGRITVTAALPLVIGGAPGTPPAIVDRFAELLRPALPIEVVDSLEGAQWTKLLINHVNALPAITGLSVQQTVADASLLRVLAASLRETVRIANRIGIRFTGLQGIPGWILPWLGRGPLAFAAWLPRRLARRMGDVPNPGSTLQSIRRGQLTEIDFLNGAAVRVAREHGFDAPINAALVALVHEVERTGEFLTPAEVAERVSTAGRA